MAGDWTRLIRWYPPPWRERYGDELSVYMADRYGSGGPPLRARWSLVAGGVRERARLSGLTGDSAPPPDRIRSAALVVLCSWTAFVVAGSSFAKLSEHFDEALPGGAGAHRLPDLAYSTIQLFAAVAGIAVIGGAAIAVPSFVRFLRSGGWPAIGRHATAAAACTFVTVATTVPLVAWAHHLSDHQRNGGLPGYAVLFLVWAALVVATLTLWTVVAVAAARRVTFSRRLLAAEAMFAVAVAAAMVTILAATALWWAGVAGRAPSFLSSDPSTPVSPQLVATVVVMALSSAVAIAGVIRVTRTFRAWQRSA